MSRPLFAGGGLVVGLCIARLLVPRLVIKSQRTLVPMRAEIASPFPSRPLRAQQKRWQKHHPKWQKQQENLGSAFEWVRKSAPWFECSDADITRAYYYRWRVFWLHLKSTRSHGWVLSEFLRHVNWAGPFGTINCAYGHHAADARWLRDESVLDNYSRFWWHHANADVRYTWWPAHAALERFNLDGRLSKLHSLYPALRREYWRWIERSVVRSESSLQCLWQAAHDDGEENSVGFDGCRPTINAAMAGEARALEAISLLVEKQGGKDGPARQNDPTQFADEAAKWRRSLHSLWSPQLQFFVTRTLTPPRSRSDEIKRRRTKLGCQYCSRPRMIEPHPPRASSGMGVGDRHSSSGSAVYPPMECPPQWPDGQLVRVRELAGLTWPWYHRVAAAEHAVAWRQLRDPDGFAAPWGATTTERRHPCYNFSSACVTSWNGPVWPFETAKLATALSHALHDPGQRAALKSAAGVTKADFTYVLSQYARMHTRGRAHRVARGEPFVGECFHGDDGYWIARELLAARRAGDWARGEHYLHSSFADLVLGGLVGIHVVYAKDKGKRAGFRTQGWAHGDLHALPGRGHTTPILVVDPLLDPESPPVVPQSAAPLPSEVNRVLPGQTEGRGPTEKAEEAPGPVRAPAWFHAAHVRVHGREVSVQYDADGTHFGGGTGIAVWLDGKLAASAATLEPLQIPL